MEIVIRNPRNVMRTEVYKRDPSTWNSDLRELCFEANVCGPRGSYRLVYWAGKVKYLFESEGYTCTIDHLFHGTEEACFAEIERLKLEPLPEDENAKISR